MRRHSMVDPHVVLTILTVMTLLWLGMPSPVAAQPANNDFDNATEVTEPLPFSDFTNTVEATTDPDDPDCIGQGPTVWYAFTPSADIRVEANTFGSDYDTALSVYTGTRDALNLIACNDDAGGTVQSRVRFDAVAGETYYFMVGAFASGPGGNLSFTVQEAPPAGPPLTIDLSVDPAGSFDRTGNATIRGTVTCSEPVFVDVYGEVRQVVGRFVILGFFGTFVECDGETAWEATASSEIGIYRGGPAKVFAQAFAYDPDEEEFAFDAENVVVRLGGGGGRSALSPSAEALPESFELKGNAPNPFNPQTTVRFSVPEASVVRLAVYDARGRQVQVLVEGALSAGAHEATLDARDLPSGVYFSRLEVGGRVFSRPMVLVK